MLVDLLIRNFAIIDELQVSFDAGLNVISGETGAGKSIIIGALGLLLGDRAASDMIRATEETATVEACYNISGMESLKIKLQELDLYRGDELFMKRTITRSGRNKVLINGGMGSLAMLSSICEMLINICGQREHQMLLNRENHIDVLDDFAGLRGFRQEYEEIYGLYLSLKRRLVELDSLKSISKAEEELHRLQLKEIVEADLKAGEEEILLEEKTILIHSQKLQSYADGAHDILYAQQGSVLEGVKVALSSIKEIRKIDPRIKIDLPNFEGIYYQIEDIALSLRDYSKNLSFDTRRLDVIEERLELLRDLKRKYGGTVEAILKKKTALEKSFFDNSAIQDEIELKRTELAETCQLLQKKAGLLSEKRKQAAGYLEAAIEQEIKTLRMENASFNVMFQPASDSDERGLSMKGLDDVEFYLSTNRGESLKPLSRIVSGGELSRIMLAMKKVLSGSSSVGTIIFDEVDSGIGGAIAEIVGEKMRDVSTYYQVICITHLPQIACFANRHFLVSKQEGAERTKTAIHCLNDPERLDEIARMLAGVELTDKARQHAREMLDSSRLRQR